MLGSGDIKDALVLGFFLAFLMGPIFFMLIQTSILYGFRRALVFDLGVVLGDAVFISIAFYSSRPALQLIKDDPFVFILGGLVLLAYGIISFFRSQNPNRLEDPELTIIEKNPPMINLFFKGFFLNFINIGVLGFWLAMIVIIGPAFDMHTQSVFQYFGFILLGYLITDMLKILLAKQLKRKMTPSVSFKMKRIIALILMVFGLFLVLKGFYPSDQILPSEFHKILEG